MSDAPAPVSPPTPSTLPAAVPAPTLAQPPAPVQTVPQCNIGLKGRTIDVKCFTSIDKIGESIGGTTWKVQIGGKPYILKQTTYTDQSLAEAKRLVDLGCNPYVACYLDYFRLENFQQQPQSLGLLIEYAQGQPLAQLIQERRKVGSTVPSTELRLLLRTGLEGLEWMHKNQMMHRDIKPQNVYVSPTGIKLVDVGLQCYDCPAAPVATTNYMAPEVLRALINDSSPDEQRADVWSLGVSLLELATLRPIFTAIGRADLYCEMQQPLDIPNPTPEIKVLEQMLTVDPKQRPSAEQLLQNELLKT